MHAQELVSPADLVLSDIDPAPPATIEQLEMAASVSELGSPELPPKWELKTLKARHKQIASLVAQGMMNKDVAPICGVTKEYVSALLRQPLIQEYIAEMSRIADTRLEAMTTKSVDTIGDILQNGTEKGRLQAARMQLEATRRIGRPDPAARPGGDGAERLEKLAERLISLQAGIRQGNVFTQNGEDVTDV